MHRFGADAAVGQFKLRLLGCRVMLSDGQTRLRSNIQNRAVEQADADSASAFGADRILPVEWITALGRNGWGSAAQNIAYGNHGTAFTPLIWFQSGLKRRIRRG